MKIIGRKTHGFLDYLVGIVLIVMPYLLRFPAGSPQKNVLIILGGAAILYSLFTNYEWGVIRIIPFRMHLVVDFFHGLLLTLSPWLFGFADEVLLPHLLAGLTELAVVTLSRPETRKFTSPSTS